MRQYGLIGRTLKHSLSKCYFEQKFAQAGRFDCSYELLELPDIQQLPTFLAAHPDLQGFNVTIPYKQQIIPFLDDLDAEAARVGAVNTVRLLREGGCVRCVGYNTDVEGFRRSLIGVRVPPRALVLGTGGAAKAVAHVLQQWQIDYRLVSRHPEAGQLAYPDITATMVRQYPFIINCTPVGTLSDERPTLPYEALTAENLLYDLVYNPAETAFLKAGAQHQAHTCNGLRMLHAQADAAWDIWQAKRRECL